MVAKIENGGPNNEELDSQDKLFGLSVRWLKNKIVPKSDLDANGGLLSSDELVLLLDNNYVFWSGLAEGEKELVKNSIEEQRVKSWEEKSEFLVNVFSTFDRAAADVIITSVVTVANPADESWRATDARIRDKYQYRDSYDAFAKRLSGLSVAIGKIRSVYYSKIRTVHGYGFDKLSADTKMQMTEQFFIDDFGVNSDVLLKTAGMNDATRDEIREMMSK